MSLGLEHNRINLPDDRSDDEFWQFFAVEDTGTTIVTHIPEKLPQSKLVSFTRALNGFARRLAEFYGCRKYKTQTAFRVDGETQNETPFAR